jgi:lipopolysaccharide export system protein LptA
MALSGSQALAEKADRDKPVNLEADTVTVDDLKQIHTYVGNVVITQGTLAIRGDKVVVKQDKEGFQHGTSYGNPASFRQKREGYDEHIEGFADRIEYDAKADKVQLYGKARMKRTGGDDVRGSHISYDANTEFYQVLGGKHTGDGSGRVRAVIQPKKKPGPAPSGTPVPLKPTESIGKSRED